MSYVKIGEDEKLMERRPYSNFEIEKGPANPIMRIITSERHRDGDIMFSPVKPHTRRWPFQRKNVEHKPVSRIIARGGDFHQSTGHVAIRKRIRREDWRALYILDWFHSVVDAPTIRIVVAITVVYIAMVLLFALGYYLISIKYGCDLGITYYVEAVAFSLQTMATIGYDTGDIFFGRCWIALSWLTFQIIVGIFADSLILGIIFCRLSRPHARASTVLFSNKGVIRRIRGKLYFMFQLCELRKHQLSEAHVRLYVVKNEVDPAVIDDETDDIEMSRSIVIEEGKSLQPSKEGSETLYQQSSRDCRSFSMEASSPLPVDKRQKYINTSAMRLNHPDDERGGMLLLMVPQLVVHEIDEFSPLMPPPVWFANNAVDENISVSKEGSIKWNPPVFEKHRNGSQYVSTTEFPNVMQRSMDELHTTNGNGNGNGGVNVYGASSVAQTPVKSNTNNNSSSNSYNHRHFPTQTNQDEEKLMIQQYLQDRQIEIIAIVEGSAATSGGQVQARHSFVNSDIEWDKTFAHCMYKDPDDGCTTIDFSLYHELVSCSKDAPSAGPIASII